MRDSGRSDAETRPSILVANDSFLGTPTLRGAARDLPCGGDAFNSMATIERANELSVRVAEHEVSAVCLYLLTEAGEPIMVVIVKRKLHIGVESAVVGRSRYQDNSALSVRPGLALVILDTLYLHMVHG